MLFLAPYLSEEELSALYSKSYFSAGIQSSLAPRPAITYEEALGVRLAKFEATLDDLQQLIPTDGALLDIGAGTGAFVQNARKRGLVADGLEFSSFAVAEARSKYGIELIEGRLGSVRLLRKYDALHLNHVLEHFSDPHAAVEAMKVHLAGEGVVYIEVPYQFNVVDRTKYWLLGTRQTFSLHSLHHPLFFTPKTLTNLFLRHGFRCIRLKLFDRLHYPVTDARSWVKAMAWQSLALLREGLFIEGIFKRDNSS